jgi:MFS family permease
LLFISLCFTFLSSIILVLDHTIHIMLISVFFLGCGMGCWGCIAVTYRQKVIPQGIFSRTNAVYRLFSWGALCVGGLMGGAIYQIIGYDSLFYMTLAFTLFLTISFYFMPLTDEL